MTARYQPERPLRADAARNRDAIVAVARGTLREDFAGEDLVLLLISTSAVMHVTWIPCRAWWS